jgi:transposase-like protein
MTREDLEALQKRHVHFKMNLVNYVAYPHWDMDTLLDRAQKAVDARDEYEEARSQWEKENPVVEVPVPSVEHTDWMTNPSTKNRPYR